MSSDPLFIVVILAVLLVLGILLMGIGSFGRGGEANARTSNKYMRWRIYAQAGAIVLILAFFFLRRMGG